MDVEEEGSLSYIHSSSSRLRSKIKWMDNKNNYNFYFILLLHNSQLFNIVTRHLKNNQQRRRHLIVMEYIHGYNFCSTVSRVTGMR